MSLIGLTYEGITTVTSGSVTGVSVMEFSLTGSSAADLSLVGACTDGVALRSSVSQGSVASLIGPATMDLVYLAGSDSTGASFSFTPTSPPPASWPYAGPYSGVAMVATAIDAQQLSLPGVTTTSSFC